MHITKGILSILSFSVVSAVAFPGSNAHLDEPRKSFCSDTIELHQLKQIIKREVSENSSLFDSCFHIFDALTKDSSSNKHNYFYSFYTAERAYYENRYEQAISLYKESARYAKGMNNALKQADAQHNIGLCYHFMGDFNTAYSYYQQSVTLYDSLELPLDLANVYQNIGIVFTDWQRYDRSIEYYRKALEINRQYSKQDRVAALVQNMGVVYYYWKHYQQAINHYQQSFKLFQQLKDLQGMGTAYMNIGVVYDDLHKPNKALEYYQKAFVSLEKINQPDVLSQLQYNIGSIYFRTHQLGKALDYFNQSLNVARANKLYNQQVLTLELLSSVYEQQGSLDKALHAYKAFHTLNDSLFSYENQQAFDQMVAQYELKVSENKVATLERERIFQAQQMERQFSITAWISTVAVILTLLSGLFIIFFLRQRKLAKQLNTEVTDHQKTTQKLEHIKVQLESHVKKRTEELWSTNHKLKEAIIKYEETFIQLAKAKDKAEEADKLKSSFLRNMSHEVRTPLNAILGFSQMLANEKNEAKRKEYVAFVEEASNNLLHIIEDVLDFSKLESGYTQINETVVEANAIIKPLESGFRKLLERKKEGTIELHVKYNTEANSYLKTDIKRVQHLMSILVENAIKFTSHGTITIGFEDQEGSLLFYCSDTGVGIEKEHQQLIFDCFRQVDTGTTRKYGGNGLGLSLAQRIATLLNTSIELTSELGKGSVFSFILPKVPREMPILSGDGETHYTFSNKAIMVVEDKPMNFYLLQEYLENTKVKLHWCKNGNEAIERLQRVAKMDLILMDIQMPVMDGLQATRLIRKSHPRVPIIAQTAYAFAQEKQNCMEAGCSDMLVKPITMHQLLEKLQTHLFPAISEERN